MPRLIDISLPISNALPTWPGDPSVSLERVVKIEEGSAANVSRLAAGVHTGTHVDAPLHFIPNDIAVEALDLDRFVGPCQVIELAGSGRISAADLDGAGVAADTERLLIKTENSAWWSEEPLRFHTEFRALDSGAARWVVERGLKPVESYEAEANNPTHGILLGARVGVLEGLDLSQVAPGRYRLLCLPLKLVGSDGAPARAVLEIE